MLFELVSPPHRNEARMAVQMPCTSERTDYWFTDMYLSQLRNRIFAHWPTTNNKAQESPRSCPFSLRIINKERKSGREKKRHPKVNTIFTIRNPKRARSSNSNLWLLHIMHPFTYPFLSFPFSLSRNKKKRRKKERKKKPPCLSQSKTQREHAHRTQVSDCYTTRQLSLSPLLSSSISSSSINDSMLLRTSAQQHPEMEFGSRP